MLTSHDILAVLTQLGQGIRGLAGAADLTHDPKLQDLIASLQNELGAVMQSVEDAARQRGIVPTGSIQPRPAVPHRLAAQSDTG